MIAHHNVIVTFAWYVYPKHLDAVGRWAVQARSRRSADVVFKFQLTPLEFRPLTAFLSLSQQHLYLLVAYHFPSWLDKPFRHGWTISGGPRAALAEDSAEKAAIQRAILLSASLCSVLPEGEGSDRTIILRPRSRALLRDSL